MSKNKVKFNLKNVHYALLTLSAQNVPSYGKPVPVPGAVSLSLDANGVLVENSESNLAAFALLFEFDGDQKHIRHVMYNCSASRPGIEGKTNEESREVQTETLTIKASPLPDGTVKAKTGDSTDPTVYNAWYEDVYMPSGESGGEDDGRE